MSVKSNDLVIVGSGLAGTITLVQELIKIAEEPSITARSPVKITILERYPTQQFAGVAYGTTAQYSGFHLNLTAKRATPFMADKVPKGFPTFPDYIIGIAGKAGDEKEKVLDYLQNPPRELFGQYLKHLVDLALKKAGNKAKVTTRIAEALDMDVTGENPKLTVRENGEMHTIEGKQVVLATGQREVLRPPFLDDMVDSPLYLEDIYSSTAKDFYDKILADQLGKKGPENVLILGTALSADDAALRLLKSGYKGKITMISRNGLEHAGYGATSTEEYLKNSLTGEPRPEKMKELEKKSPRFMRVVDAAATAQEDPKYVEKNLDTALRREFAILMKRGYMPEEVLGYWERFIPDMASVLSDETCGNLYNKYATWMGVHRVGTTPENMRLIKEAQESGQLEIISGFIASGNGERIKEENGKVVVTYTPTERTQRAGVNGGAGTMPRTWDSEWEKGRQQVTRKFDYALSGLGYVVTYDESRDPFWRNMIDKGLSAPHKKAGDGLELDPNDLTLLDAAGRRVENVTAVGIPAFGATMYGRFPHPEKPGVFGGRILPFTANIVGVTGGVIAMVDQMHRDLMQKRGLEVTPQSKLEAAFAMSALRTASKVVPEPTAPQRGPQNAIKGLGVN